MKLKRKAHKQEGVALITALIITSVAVSLATLIIYRQQIQIRLTSNISSLEQNYQYAYGMEDFAGTILRTSWEEQKDFVSLNDAWHSESGLVLPITGGLMTGKLYDLHARINVNSLIRPKTEIEEETSSGTGTGSASGEQNKTEKKIHDIAKVTKERLGALIRNIDTDQEMGPPDNFAIILRDWIDIDHDNGKSLNISNDDDIGTGAETPFYQTQEPAYYSANSELISPTELRLLKNMKEEFYQEISNEISTLPTSINNKPTTTSINVNTASEKVLAALGFTPDAVTNIIESRKEEPFASIGAFLEFPDVINVLITEDNPDDGSVDPLDLDVKSEYFLLMGKVEINDTRLFVNSILRRNQNGQVSVIMRDFSNPQTINKVIN